MHLPFLLPGEMVLDTFPKVWLETPDRINRVFSKAMIYTDSGSMLFTSFRIIYQGTKFFFPMEKITFVGRHKVPGKIGMGQGYVRLDTPDPAGMIQTIFFLGGGSFVWTVGRRSDELYGKIVSWIENIYKPYNTTTYAQMQPENDII
jgi:hypothetical protein